MSDYTEAEKRALLAGIVGGRERDAVWSKFPKAVESLGDRGLVRVAREKLADGTAYVFPLCLSPAGVLEARSLPEAKSTDLYPVVGAMVVDEQP